MIILLRWFSAWHVLFVRCTVVIRMQIWVWLQHGGFFSEQELHQPKPFLLPLWHSSSTYCGLRCNFICTRDKSYTTAEPILPDITKNGWAYEGDLLVAVSSTQPPAPTSVIQLRRCSCKTGCKTRRCSCLQNELQCTSLCKCFTLSCDNFKVNEPDHDSESDDEYV